MVVQYVTIGHHRTIEFPIGEMYYSVSAPTDTESSAAQFLNSTGGRGGIHYISIASSNSK